MLVLIRNHVHKDAQGTWYDLATFNYLTWANGASITFHYILNYIILF